MVAPIKWGYFYAQKFAYYARNTLTLQQGCNGAAHNLKNE